MSGTVAGANALVTGAGTQGIGRAAALGLAKEGADVAIHALSENNGSAELAQAIEAMGRRAPVFAADFREPSAARDLVRRADAELGGLDIVVNNAATTLRKPALETSDEEFERLLRVNLVSQFACAQEAARLMRKRGANRGRIIMITSVNQQLAVEGQIAYCASKGGVMQMAKVLALELAATGITVNMIAPGTIETDLNRELLSDPAFREHRLAPIPMHRLGMPDDVANAVTFLARADSGYITGATLTVDGGLTLA